jgi:hypothetical protein
MIVFVHEVQLSSRPRRFIDNHVEPYPRHAPVLSLAQAAMQEADPEIQADHYDIARADLDGDGKDEVLALMNVKSGYCGSGGCTLFVLMGKENGFSKVCSIAVVNPPIYLRKTSTKDMRDLLVTVSGGGATPGLAVLSFDGTTYPPAPGEATAKREEGDSILFAEPSTAFEKSLTLQGITFNINSPNTATANTLSVTPSGLSGDNSPQKTDISAVVTGAEVADLNADGFPEIYIYTQDDSNRAGLIAWSSNKNKSLSQISLPELGEHAKGYRGGDEFAVMEGILARRFPIYPENSTQTEPTGKIRQLQYKLHPGEAGWLLKVDQVTVF